jgi:hypothetical protein
LSAFAAASWPSRSVMIHISVADDGRISLPIYPDKQTISEPVGCHCRKLNPASK